MLAIGRALMTNPSLLLLDEPLEGLAPVIVAEVASCIRALSATGDIAIVLAEQHVNFAFDLARSALVLSRGQICYSGPSETLRNDTDRLDELIGLRQSSPGPGLSPEPSAQ